MAKKPSEATASVNIRVTSVEIRVEWHHDGKITLDAPHLNIRTSSS